MLFLVLLGNEKCGQWKRQRQREIFFWAIKKAMATQIALLSNPCSKKSKK